MRAIVYDRYGAPDVLRLADIAVPEIADDEVLVRVRAASVNSWDWDLVTGTPVFFRFWGLFKPKHRVPGADIAGQIEAVGKKVTRFRPGDEVFGDLCQCGWGGFAELARARESALALKPAGMTFEQAAATPQAGAMALQGLRDEGAIRPAQTILINGAGGGVGTFAIQIAKSFGAEVTGVDRAEKLETMRSVGADHVVDYAREDFAENGRTYDLILDAAAHRSMFDYSRALSPGGTYVMLGGAVGRILELLLLGPWISRSERKKMRIMAAKANHELGVLAELFQAGKVRPVIDRCYPLAEVADAFRYFGEGRACGKIVITL
ncbi:NAD(P)-dependent alcohol dehydrogenase [Sorangium sp. So ce542]|uniref:NAD(P)-dependent alcohol dehydrogenase n=1 Tax=Sorangium sp. So ce542 TaxID=3133316 RepID=UPI003F5F80DA